MILNRENCYKQSLKNNMPLFFNYFFRRNDFFYWIPPPPFYKWEEKGTYIKINNNIYAEGSYKTFSSYEFIVNKRGGESGKISFNYPVDYIKINDKVEYYLKGKLKFIGYVEYIDGASKELSIIPAWGKLNYQLIVGTTAEEETLFAYDIINKALKQHIIKAGILWNDDLITIPKEEYTMTMKLGGRSIADILDEIEEEMSDSWCWGVDFNNTFYFTEINEKPKKIISYFENNFSESEFEEDSSDLVSRYICKVGFKNDDTSGTKILPVIVGDNEKYPPIDWLDNKIGIKFGEYETTLKANTNDDLIIEEVYKRAYQLLSKQINKEVIKLKNINFNKIDIDFNECVKIIMKPENNYYNDTTFEEPVYNAYENNNLYSSEILQLGIEIDKEIIPNYKQANEINLYDIDLGYKKMTLKSYSLKKLFIYYSFQDTEDSSKSTGIFSITDGNKSQRKYCTDGFGEFDIQGYDKIKLKIINERSNVLYNKITVFFDLGVKEYSMNARKLIYTYNNNSLSVNGEFAKMNVKLSNYLHELENRRKRTENAINNN